MSPYESEALVSYYKEHAFKANLDFSGLDVFKVDSVLSLTVVVGKVMNHYWKLEIRKTNWSVSVANNTAVA